MVLFCIVLLIVLAANFSQAAEPAPLETLPPVVVTATRTEVPLNQLTTSLTVITAEDIREQQAELVLEVLRDVPGVDVVQSGSIGTATSVFIRGAASNQALVLIDGVEINSTTTGAYDFANLTTESIERIEVLRGAGGTLYGSQAIGGVINIITKRGQGPLEVGLSAQGGNWWTNRQVAALRGAAGKVGYSFSVGHIGSRGFESVNDDYRNLSTSARLDYEVTENANLKGIFHFINSDTGLFNNNNFASVPDPNARQDTTQYVAKLEWLQKIMANWDYRISGSFYKEHDKFSDDVDSCVSFGFPCDSRTRDIFRPQIATGEFQTNYRLEEWSTSTFGVQYNRRSASTNGGIDEAIGNVGYYLQQQFQFFDRRLIAIPGIRLDDNQQFGTAWTPSFSAAYLFKEIGTKVKGGYAKGFRAPSLNELFFPAGFGCPAFGNPNLGPEKSWEINFGVEQNFLAERLKMGANYFHREVKDLIEGRPIPGDPLGCFRAENVGRARFDGVELTLGIKLLEGLTLNANYTYLDWDTADGTLPRRPHNQGNVMLNYLRDGLNINLITHIVGRRDDFRAAAPFGDIVTPGYVTVDLASSYVLPWRMPFVKEVNLIGKIQNLFNKKYEQVDGFRSPPLNFLFGFRARFGNE
ncbi:MAG TPA: TonB-dependent receptor [Candidatus Binatia bacterium]|nr:TonB-dependent receptor [Candidatus Binatia bacterium]